MKKILLLMLILFLAAPAYAMNISDNVDLGGQVRFRGYDIQNFWDFDYGNDYDNYSTFRLKSSLNAKVSFDNDVTGFVQFTNQTYGDGVSLDGGGDNKDNKVFADNAYINVDKLFTMPVDLRVGRQNVMYGTGFVLFDGQSQFASTSIYFDGVKASIHLGENAVLDALYLKDQENKREDNPKDDITLAGAYLTAHCPVMHGQQELYALNRTDDNNDKNIWMYGLRLSDKFDFGLDYSGEIAYQTGDAASTDTDQDALGYKLQAGYSLNDVVAKPRFFLGYVSLSGDDPASSDYEGWDVFYGGWPQYGDLLAWMYVNIPPNKIAQDPTQSFYGEAAYTNLNMASAGLSTSIDKFFAEASYTMITFDEDVNGCDDFGDYYQLKASYAYTKNLKFSIYAAMIEPGDVYKDMGMNDEAYEFFWEADLRF